MAIYEELLAVAERRGRDRPWSGSKAVAARPAAAPVRKAVNEGSEWSEF